MSFIGYLSESSSNMAPAIPPAEGCYDSFLEFVFDNNVPRDLSTETTEARASIRKLATEVNTPKTADELIRTYSGQEGLLIKNLSKMKLREDEIAPIIAEIKTLVIETDTPKSAEELLKTYIGREEMLLKNLKKVKEIAPVVADIKTLVDETNTTKTAEELLANYAGREEILLKNLKKMKLREEEIAPTVTEIKTLVDETNAPKTSEELLATYIGQEYILLKNLKKVKAKQDNGEDVMAEVAEMKKQEVAYEEGVDQVMIAEIRVLVEEAKTPKSADELLASYAGKEKMLLENLRKFKAKQDGTEEKKSSGESVNGTGSPGKKKNYNDLIKEKQVAQRVEAGLPVSSSLKRKKDYNDLIKEKQASTRL
mmetsp:Transcript_34797/g.64007  ORF Transcript_34797/g.64007 Transcript_34797/m.64007 type:complete len:368 (+) Transcript_34797:52-1155(+)